MKKKVELTTVAMSRGMYEKVRALAFQRRMSIKNIVEEALRKYYKWGKEE